MMLTLDRIAQLAGNLDGAVGVAAIVTENNAEFGYGFMVAYRDERDEDRAYSTHAAYWRADGGKGLEGGHYEMSRDEAMADLAKRVGVTDTALDKAEAEGF